MVVPVGAVAGLFGSLLGLGGGWLATPSLAMLGLPAAHAVGTSLAAMVPSSAHGVLRHWRAGRIAPRNALLLGIPATIGVEIARRVHQSLAAAGQGELAWTIAFLVLLAGLLATARKKRITIDASAPTRILPVLPMLALGLGAGLLSGFLGIGGGIIIVPVLTRGYGVAWLDAAAASLSSIVISATFGAMAYAYAGTISLPHAALIAVGMIAGSELGSRVARFTTERLLSKLFAALAATTGIALALMRVDRPVTARVVLYGVALAMTAVLLVSVRRAAKRKEPGI